MSWLRPSRLVVLLLTGISFAALATLPTVPAAPAEPPLSYGLAGLLQAGLGLALVLALIFLCAWAMRRLGLQQSGGNRLVKVVSSVMVGQRERVVVVEVGDSWLVLGVAAGQVNALHTLPAEQHSDLQAAKEGHGNAAASAFSQTLRNSLQHLNKLRKTP
jgi:flagellar protein FliO/FliZ